MAQAAPLLFSADSLAASGGAVDIQCSGLGPLRLYVKAKTSQLTSMAVSIGPDVDHLTAITSTVFNSLAQDATAQLLIDAPVNLMRLTPTGNHFDVRVSRAQMWDN